MNVQTVITNPPTDNDNSDRTQTLDSWARNDPRAIIKLER